MTVVAESLIHRHLVDATLWNRLVNRLIEDEVMERPLAERVMNEALGFLALCARDAGDYAPSPLVDVGWHAFILYTREYAMFCQRVAGGFIHHAPTDEPGIGYRTGGVARTLEALQRHGLSPDEALWTHATGDPCYVSTCKGQCHQCGTGG